MGLFGGSKKSTTQNITTTTETTTNIRDIGFTGAQAVKMAATLQAGANESEAIRAQSLDNIVQQVGANYNQLVGGANNLIQAGTKNVQAGYQQVTDAGNLVQNSAREATNTIRTLAEKATNEDSDFVKVMPYIAVVGIGLISFILTNK